MLTLSSSGIKSRSVRLASILLGITFIFGFPIGINLLTVHNHGGFDISWYSQVLHRISVDGEAISTIVLPLHQLSNHFDIIMYPLAWIYSLISSLGLPAYAYLIGVTFIPLALVIKWLLTSDPLKTPKDGSVGIFVLFLGLNWTFMSPNAFEFHATTLGLNLFVASVIAYHLHKAMIATTLVALSFFCGEMWIHISLVSLITYMIANSKLRLFNKLMILALGSLVGVLLTAAYFAWFKQKFALAGNFSNFILERYSHLGRSLTELAFSPFVKPKIFFGSIFQADKVSYLLMLVGPFVLYIIALVLKYRSIPRPSNQRSFLFFISGIIVIPIPLLKVLMSDYKPYLDPRLHYTADIAPGLILILYSFLQNPKYSSQKHRHQVATVCIWAACILGITPIATHLIKKTQLAFNGKMISQELRTYLSNIDATYSVYTDNLAYSHLLSERSGFYSHFADAWIPKDELPDLLLLSWPAEHFNQGHVVSNSFRKSLKMDSTGNMISHYHSSSSLYTLRESFVIPSWGTITLWQKAHHVKSLN